MKKRITALLLALFMLLEGIPAALAEEESRLAVAAVTGERVVIAPQYVNAAAGETVWQVLSGMQGHTFTGAVDGFITEIDGVSGNYNRFDDRGGYDLNAPAADTACFVFTELSAEDPGAYCRLVCAMADYAEAQEPVRNYAAVEYAAAEAALLTAEAHDAAATALKEKMEAYQAVLDAEKKTLRLTVTDLSGSPLTDYAFAAKNAYGTGFTFAAGEKLQLAEGRYDFQVTAGFNGARGTMTVLADGAVQMEGKTVSAVKLPADAQWLAAPILHRTSGKLEGDAYPSAEGTDNSSIYYVPDAVKSAYIYCPVGKDLPKTGGSYNTDSVSWAGLYRNTAGAEIEKVGAPWASINAVLKDFLDASSRGGTAVIEARYAKEGYTAYQQYRMEILRVPTLSALALSVQRIPQNFGFTPEGEHYTCRVTADEITLTPTAFDEAYAVSVNGEPLRSGEGRTVALTEPETALEVQVAHAGQSRRYTLTVEKTAAVSVTVQHAADVKVHVFNSAGAEIGPASAGGTQDVFRLVPGEGYTYVTDREIYYHAKGSFTAEEGLTLAAAAPQTEDALDGLWLAASSMPVAKNKSVLLQVPKAPAHSHTVSVTDASSSLYIWVQNAGYTFTALETGYTVNQKETGSTGQFLRSFLRTGDETQTLTLRATKNGGGEVEQYQDYSITLHKILTLKDTNGLRLTAEGIDTPLSYKNTAGEEVTGFDRDITDYRATLPRSAEEAVLTLEPYGENYYVYVNGRRYAPPADEQGTAGSFTVRVPLDTEKDQEVISITPGSERVPVGAQRRTYTLTIHKKAAVETLFTVRDPSGQPLADALVCVYDNRTGKRVWPREDGCYLLVDTLLYTYVVTCPGYVGQSQVFTAGKGSSTMTLTMTAAPESRYGEGITSSWDSFRGNNAANGVIEHKTPITAQSAYLSWASKLGKGFDTAAVGCPILITEDGYDYLIVYSGKKLFKVDAVSGVTVAEGEMDHNSSFAINSATFAQGMLFVGLADGGVQAFDAATLKSLWLYQDALGGQPNCPITYWDGCIYTGFWNKEDREANLVCLSITDEDPASEKESKLPRWTYTSPGGFYWAGAYVCEDYLLIGTDDGTGGCTSETAALLCIDPATGKLMDAIKNLRGDIRSNISYADGRFYFTSKGGYFYSVAAPQKQGDIWRLDKDSLRAVALENGGTPSQPAMSTCTPVVYKDRAYIGVSGTGQFTQYSGHSITVIDLKTWQIAYSVPTQGYPQTSGLLTTAYSEGDGAVYVYFFDNFTPGKLRVLKDTPGQIKPVLTTQESFIDKDKATVYQTPYVLFTPADAQAQYAICSPIADSFGTIYFKNDSAHLMALASSIVSMEVTRQPDKTAYVAGEYFDPTGMEITLTYANGLSRTLPAERTVNGKKIAYFTWPREPLRREDEGELLLHFAYSLYQDGEDGVGTQVTSVPALLSIQVEPAGLGDLNGDGAVDIFDLQCLYTYLSTGAIEGDYSGQETAYREAADYNRDGQVDILDYQALYEAVKRTGGGRSQ